jgi:multidrug resistance efflux pump
MSKKLQVWFLPLVALASLAFGVRHMVVSQRAFATPKADPPVQPAVAPFASQIAAAGLIEARSENIAVGSALAGVVLEVQVPAAAVGRRVQAGDPLFRVDDRLLRAQVAIRQANLAASQSQLARLEATPRPEELPVSAAKVNAAVANLAMMQDQFERGRQLKATSAISTEEETQRRRRYETAQALLAQAEAEDDLLRAGAWEADKQIARAAVA